MKTAGEFIPDDTVTIRRTFSASAAILAGRNGDPIMPLASREKREVDIDE